MRKQLSLFERWFGDSAAEQVFTIVVFAVVLFGFTVFIVLIVKIIMDAVRA